MVKRSKKIYYKFHGQLRDVRYIHDTLQHEHRNQHHQYLYNITVLAHTGSTEFPLRLVFVK